MSWQKQIKRFINSQTLVSSRFRTNSHAEHLAKSCRLLWHWNVHDSIKSMVICTDGVFVWMMNAANEVSMLDDGLLGESHNVLVLMIYRQTMKMTLWLTRMDAVLLGLRYCTAFNSAAFQRKLFVECNCAMKTFV